MRYQSKLLAVAICALIIIASLSVYLAVAQLKGEKTIRVACVGDSITSDTNYPNDLSELLGPNYNVENFGVGRTTASLEFEKPYFMQPEAQLAQLFNPKIVVIMLGTNDGYLSAEQRNRFTNDYTVLINSFQTLSSKPKIYVLTPPPVFDNTMELNGTTVQNKVLPLVKETANSLGLPLIDVNTVLLGHPEYFKDGVHPNSDGAKIIATQVYNAITQNSS